MSKFNRSRSSKFTTQNPIRRLSLQQNAEVVDLQKAYEIEIVKKEDNTISQTITMKPTEKVDVIYTPKVELPMEVNPASKQMNKDTVINYGDSLDYLYKKNKNKK